jgi:branched-chain amino acid transport system ATP-binding protein
MPTTAPEATMPLEPAAAGPMLEVHDLEVSYGAVNAVRGIDLSIRRGEVVALLGANGAGKTTTLKAIRGLVPKAGGSVVFNGRDITRDATESIVQSRITLTPEGRHVFANLTVAENLQLGAAIVRDNAELTRLRTEMLELFPILRKRSHQLAGTLSGGEQQQLAIARSLLCGPELLMLDEPSLGLAPIIVEHIFSLVSDLKARGITILIVEQNVTQTLAVADRAYVLSQGEIGMQGDAASLLGSAGIERTYLGLGAI